MFDATAIRETPGYIYTTFRKQLFCRNLMMNLMWAGDTSFDLFSANVCVRPKNRILSNFDCSKKQKTDKQSNKQHKKTHTETQTAPPWRHDGLHKTFSKAYLSSEW